MTKKSTKFPRKQKLQVGDQYQSTDSQSNSLDPFLVNADPFVLPQGNAKYGWQHDNFVSNLYSDDTSNKSKDSFRNQFSNLKGHDYFPLGLYAIDNYLIGNDVRRQQQEMERNLRNQGIQKAIFDYNNIHGTDSSGGTQYQSIVMAKQGANIRRGTSPDITNVEVEGGEFIQLPDMSTQHVYGPSHEKGGVHTNLPDGARVFSDHIKPFGSKKTYAQLAKKYDTEKYRKVLDNPYADDVDRNTAKLMFEKNQSILNELFEDQQRQNGNSDGTDQAKNMAKFGLDLKKGEKLSFTDPFEYGGVYGGGYAEFQDGGGYGYTTSTRNNWALPADEEIMFQQFFNTLPSNLKVDDNTYNIRGYWDGLGRPTEFDYSQPTDEDGFYHATSRHPRTGMILKAPSHPTYQLAMDADKEMGYSRMIDPMGNIYSISPDDMPSEGYFATYQDGGQFTMKGPNKSSYYQGTTGDTSNLTTGTKKKGSPKFEEGGYISPNGKKYKLPEGAVVKNEGDKGIKAGDYVRSSDGLIRKVTKVQAKVMAKASQSSAAKSFEEGRVYINAWAGESPDNEAKLKRAEQVIAEGIKSGQIKETKPAGWKEGDPVQITITGNFKPSFRDRMIISEVINKSGKGFGTANYMITGQEGTPGYYDEKNKAGSFVGGMTPEDYEQRATYERALAEGKTPQEAEALATSTDAKQKLENRKMYLQELGIDFTDVPESVLKGDDFYKFHFQDITDNIEKRFSEAGYKPRYGNDALSGWEHYDAASYTMNPSYAAVEEEQDMPGGNNPQYESKYKPYPSTLGEFPLYQATPEALGFMYANRPYSYYTPDFTHTEIAPPTLNIDPQLQAIDDSFQSAIRQNTGNASIGNARNAAMFNQALAAKQQAFGTKQNYDAEARFKADMYNAAARDQENVRDLTAASTIYNDYMAAAQDAAEVERLAAINSLVTKKGQFDRDEYLKAFYTAQLLPNYYYDGSDPRNPLKLNPNNPDFYSRYPKPDNTSSTTKTNQTTPQAPGSSTPGLKSTVFQAPPAAGPEPVVIPEMNPAFGWSYNNFVPGIPTYMDSPQYREQVGLYPTFSSEYSVPSSYDSLNPIPTVVGPGPIVRGPEPLVIPDSVIRKPSYDWERTNLPYYPNSGYGGKLRNLPDYTKDKNVMKPDLYMYGGKIYKK